MFLPTWKLVNRGISSKNPYIAAISSKHLFFGLVNQLADFWLSEKEITRKRSIVMITVAKLDADAAKREMFRPTQNDCTDVYDRLQFSVNFENICYNLVH